MKKKKVDNTKCKKFDFKGEFRVDGVYGGECEVFWLVNEDTYKKIKGEGCYLREAISENRFEIFIEDLFDFNNDGKKQTISIRISND